MDFLALPLRVMPSKEGNQVSVDRNKKVVLIAHDSITAKQLAHLNLRVNLHDLLVDALRQSVDTIESLYPSSPEGILPEHMEEFKAVKNALVEWNLIFDRLHG